MLSTGGSGFTGMYQITITDLHKHLDIGYEEEGETTFGKRR
jgi:hypothetical protein